ncbi:MAG: NAD-dependent epimerase/dehydratase family protein [Cytophagaceae bacterium]|nr:NAD-dependent epimerase/dehydratase family protein [Gemmatimonadaceae bacterium]
MIATSAAGVLGLITSREALAAGPSPRRAPLRILFLGGTGFIGPHMVRTALDRGHKITLFTRGRQGTELFPEAERLVGDRDGKLDALKGKSWDVVIDNSGYVPSHVQQSAELLKGSVGHYFYTSTIDAYRDFHTAGITESYPLATLPPGTPHDPQNYYGPLKALCEAEVVKAYPSNHTIVRPGWVSGPGDNNHLFTYWVLRVERGGEILAPGTPNDPFQTIDARDLGAFVIASIEERRLGAFNAVGPVITFGEMLNGVKSVMTTPSTFTWVDADFLRAEKVRPYFGMPLWWPPRNDYQDPGMRGGLNGGIGAFNLDGAKARAAGLKHRPLTDMARDTLTWYRGAFSDWPEQRRPGLSAVREQELLAKWRSRGGG